jgi:D-alanyl-D-alanine carboxypeptidase
LNPETNAQGTEGNMDSAVIKIFRDAGFEWGGDWQGKVRDPMHFQFCTGY